ncbi:MAG TPA: polyphosphate kinase 1 [Phycisphaerales bacterium]|nr:polyphosphate kinase 1 [Phycisphaerales bacterium]
MTATRPAQPAAAPGAPEEPRYFNRDLSLMEFNRRVLAQAGDDSFPLLERVKFLAIFASNTDEFFMKRVGLLKRFVISGLDTPTPDGRRPSQTLGELRAIVKDLQATQARLWQQMVPELAAAGVHVLTYDQLETPERDRVDQWYRDNAFPILTPLAVDPGHKFPFISNLSENLGVLVGPPGSNERLFARIKIPDVLPRFVTVEQEGERVRLLPLDELVRHNLRDLFPGMTIHEVMPFRLTRNASIETKDGENENLYEHVEAELQLRRFASAVRIEAPEQPCREILDFVLAELGLSEDDVYARAGPLEYKDLFEIGNLERPDLKLSPYRPVAPAILADEKADIFALIRERDILLHHPYESFNASVERFIAAAARDPDVLAIKQTIYRTSRDSPFVTSLIRAAEDGKQVACLVELRARFDEQKNLRFARQLEKHGVHVAYGVVGLKTHCKCSLVVRRESHGLRCYAHVGTGNYNPATAQLYTDLGLLTCNTRITEDVVSLFNLLTGRSALTEYNELLVAPVTMRNRFNELIDAEVENARAGRPARIFAKMNALEDTAMTEKLYEASQAGVPVELVVRGFCCLRPRVPGLSDNIRVWSIVGRFLEHSRVFHFADGRDDPVDGRWYIGSGDWMYRNLNDRVEAACPVYDLEARQRLTKLRAVLQRDRKRAWDLQPSGEYVLRTPPEGADEESAESGGSFRHLMHLARAGTPV